MQILTPPVIKALCSCTDVSPGLLTRLKVDEIITPGLLENIKQERDPFTKADMLYNFLKITRKDDDLPKLKEALEGSKNSNALQVLVEAETKLLSNSTDTKKSVFGHVDSPNKGGELVAGPVKVRTLAGILINDEEVINNLAEFWKRFPKVQLAVIKPYLDGYAMRTVTPMELVGKVLATWQGKHGLATTIEVLIGILAEEDEALISFPNSAENIRKKFNGNAKIE